MEIASADEVLQRASERGAQSRLPYFGALRPPEAMALLAAGAAKLVDVRTRAEWEWVGRIPGSIQIEWRTYPEGRQNPAFVEQLAEAVPDRETPILFICRSGGRSDSAARAATAAGYRRCLNVLEGFEGDRDSSGHRGTINGWRKAGLPWVQG